MRCLSGVVCMLAVSMASVAQPARAQGNLPAQLVLRPSYFLYLDADAGNGSTSDGTEWNDNAEAESVEPNLDESVSSSAPSDEVPDIETLSQRAIEHYEIQSAQSQKQRAKRKRGWVAERTPGKKAGIALGVIVGVGGVVLATGAAVVLSGW